MILTLDVGNSQIFGGVFQDDRLRLQFRKATKNASSSDEIGLFLKSVLRENDIEPKLIQKIAICSVVPEVIHSLRNACRKYFNIPPFILQAGTKTGLRIKYRNPLELGADRIANTIGAVHLYPNRNIIIVDLGTATTFCVVTKDKDYLGGLILPGLRLSMEALVSKTAKLPSVEIIAPQDLIGRSTVENIQSGLYFGNLCILQEISRRIRVETLKDPEALIVGTGGFSRLFEKERVFDALQPDLVLMGLHQALKMNS
jgi:type III pantothenate kinase